MFKNVFALSLLRTSDSTKKKKKKKKKKKRRTYPYREYRFSYGILYVRQKKKKKKKKTHTKKRTDKDRRIKNTYKRKRSIKMIFFMDMGPHMERTQNDQIFRDFDYRSDFQII